MPHDAIVRQLGVGVGIFVATGGVGAPLATQAALGILAASASSATSGALGTALNGGSFGDCLIAGTKGAIFGGMSAMAAVGIGDKFKEIGLIAKSKFLTEAARAGAHSVTQGAIAVFRGGDFWQGAASGALGSIGVSIYGGDNLWITVAIGSVSAGAGAVIGGAETAEEILFGMATGAIVGALNGWVHEWEHRQVQRIYNLLAKTKGSGLTYRDIVKGINPNTERTLNLTGVVSIEGEKVRLCMTIDLSKNHMDKGLVQDGNIKFMDNAKFKGDFQTVMRDGRYTLYNYKTYLPNIKMTTDPFHLSFPAKYDNIIGF